MALVNPEGLVQQKGRRSSKGKRRAFFKKLALLEKAQLRKAAVQAQPVCGTLAALLMRSAAVAFKLAFSDSAATARSVWRSRAERGLRGRRLTIPVLTARNDGRMAQFDSADAFVAALKDHQQALAEAPTTATVGRCRKSMQQQQRHKRQRRRHRSQQQRWTTGTSAASRASTSAQQQLLGLVVGPCHPSVTATAATDETLHAQYLYHSATAAARRRQAAQ
eukprot:9026-Heterococcus_DN1.PRE.1